MKRSGAVALLDLLADSGVRYLFGNPGTTELPLMDALVGHRIAYRLALQEVPVMSMADGYAMASRQPAVVNLHISCGLGNAMGMLYNAYREGTPLIVTAGQQDRRLRFEEPILGGDMVSVARPWTKWSAEVDRVEDLPNALRRALQTAVTPPTGPVFLSLPMDILTHEADHCDWSPARPVDARIRPPVEALRQAAAALARARNPVILSGSRTLESDAVHELAAVADCLGAPVMAEPGTTHGRLAFLPDHPLAAAGLPLWAPDVLARLQEFDLILAVGLDLLRLYVYFEPSRPLPRVPIVHFDNDPWQLGKNYPLEVGVWGDLKCGLRELAEELERALSTDQKAAAAQRGRQRRQTIAATRTRLQAQAAQESAARPITPLTAMRAIGAALPPDVAVIEEAVTTTNAYLERLGYLKNATGYFGHRGWALGWGLGCSLGVKLAWPDRPVLALLGDGAALYGIQGLWTAAHYRIPVTFVVFHNAQYQILKIGARGQRLPAALAGKFEGLDIVDPVVDYVALSQSLGVAAERITEPEVLQAKVRESLVSQQEPQLFEVPIYRGLPDDLQYQ